MYGATNQYGTISLANACIEADVSWKGAAHSTEADTLATLDLINKIAQFNIDINKAKCFTLIYKVLYFIKSLGKA